MQKKSRWHNDNYPDLHDMDFLWASMVRCHSGEIQRMNPDRIRDKVLWRLFRVGVFDLPKGDKKTPNPISPALWHSTAMASRLLNRCLRSEDKVGSRALAFGPKLTSSLLVRGS